SELPQDDPFLELTEVIAGRSAHRPNPNELLPVTTPLEKDQSSELQRLRKILVTREGNGDPYAKLGLWLATPDLKSRADSPFVNLNPAKAKSEASEPQKD